MAAAPAIAERPRYDLLIDDGLIVDGTGAAPRRGDVAIRGDRIVRIAPRIDPARAARVIDARSLIVAPGFIEPHAHITAIADHPLAENFLRQGVTTIVNSLHSLDQPYPLGPFLDGLRVAPNTVWTTGHSWLRKRVIGLENRAPSAAELAEMQRLASDAMDDGAIGLATGLEYIPANFAKADEIEAIARATRRPHALYMTHLRDEGSALIPAVEEALAVGRAAKLPVHINHLKSTGVSNAGAAERVLGIIDDANTRGARVSFDVYPYDAYSTYSTVLFPSWALAGGTEGFRARIADPVVRARLLAELPAIFAAQTLGTLDSVQFRDIAGDTSFAGRTLGDWLRANNRPATIEAGMAALIELQAAGGFTGIFRAMADRDIDAFLRHSSSFISSDGDLVTPGEGYPHPRSYGAFPRVLARYVRERPVLSLEEAVRKMTSGVADVHGLAGRGRLVVGAYADIVVFDANRIADRATFTDPHHYSEGVVHVLVNGVPVLADGRVTGARPGRPLRRIGWRRR